ncbi:ribosomal protein L22/L17 [Chiua virens]|nr:ribosomal protein L22/L17 [Chiua virens]
MVRYAAAALATNPEKTARARGEYLRTHFKNMREVAAALSGMKLTRAYSYLGDVVEHKQVIPFRRYSGGVGRASQAKQFKTTQGRWPEKSVKFITRLLKNAEANADAKSLELEELTYQKHCCSTSTPRRSHRKLVAARTVHMVGSIPTRVTLAMLR